MNKHKTVLLAALCICGAVLVCVSCGEGRETTPSFASGTEMPLSPQGTDSTPNTGLPGGYVIQHASWGSVQDPEPEEVIEPDITRMGYEAGLRLINQRKAAKRLKNMEIFIRR